MGSWYLGAGALYSSAEVTHGISVADWHRYPKSQGFHFTVGRHRPQPKNNNKTKNAMKLTSLTAFRMARSEWTGRRKAPCTGARTTVMTTCTTTTGAVDLCSKIHAHRPTHTRARLRCQRRPSIPRRTPTTTPSVRAMWTWSIPSPLFSLEKAVPIKLSRTLSVKCRWWS